MITTSKIPCVDRHKNVIVAKITVAPRTFTIIKNFLQIVILAVPLLLNGCYTPVIEGAQQGYDVSRRDSFKTEAVTDDPVPSTSLVTPTVVRAVAP